MSCFSYNGVGNLVVINGIMDRFQYLDIIQNNLPDSAQKMNLNNYTFQQDNDPKHTSGIIKEYFVRNDIQCVDHPAQSPDLNPIEHLWAYIKRKLDGKNFARKDELIIAVKAIWDEIPITLCQNLIVSMKKRVKAVLLAKGAHIDY